MKLFEELAMICIDRGGRGMRLVSYPRGQSFRTDAVRVGAADNGNIWQREQSIQMDPRRPSTAGDPDSQQGGPHLRSRSASRHLLTTRTGPESGPREG